jgi:hypothetical protein
VERTVVTLAVDRRYAGYLTIADEPNPEESQAIQLARKTHGIMLQNVSLPSCLRGIYRTWIVWISNPVGSCVCRYPVQRSLPFLMPPGY